MGGCVRPLLAPTPPRSLLETEASPEHQFHLEDAVGQPLVAAHIKAPQRARLVLLRPASTGSRMRKTGTTTRKRTRNASGRGGRSASGNKRPRSHSLVGEEASEQTDAAGRIGAGKRLFGDKFAYFEARSAKSGAFGLVRGACARAGPSPRLMSAEHLRAHCTPSPSNVMGGKLGGLVRHHPPAACCP